MDAPTTLAVIVEIIGGFIILLAGRRIYWALIILSSLAGADGIVAGIDRAFGLHATVAALLVIALAFVGIAVQNGGSRTLSKVVLPALD
jgi:hypothetical protein